MSVPSFLYLWPFLLIFGPSILLEAQAEIILPAERPQESITYWKPFEIASNEDPKVKQANDIFDRLLLGWEEARVAPELHVVRSEKGPWAASLDDGTVLLSREAIDVCLKEGIKGGTDRLAFVLAHELAHQRADHLWHRRFFRLAGQEPPQVKGRMLGGISVDQLEVADLEAKETQADREGLLLMAMVGFDPRAVVGDESRFFFEWIESIWGESCGDGADSEDCAKAKSRYERARAHWREAAHQSVLFDLGVQAYVAGRYGPARQFFMAYGRQFPRREVHNNIGLTHIGEALDFRKRLLAKGEDLGPEFVYPLIMEEGSGVQRERPGGEGGTRGGIDKEVAGWRKEMEHHLTEAALSFERGIKTDPGHRQSYWNLASTYLLAGNAPLAYGITAGNYVKRFGQDAIASMFLGMSAYLDGQPEKARSLLDQAVAGADRELILFMRMNRAVYLGAVGDQEGERAEWKTLADMGRKQGDEGIFRLALQKLGKQIEPESSLNTGTAERIHGYTIAHRVPATAVEALGVQGDEVWLEGERIQVYHFSDGGRMVVGTNRVVLALWQEGGEVATAAGIRIGDDAAKLGRAYGIPTRKIKTIQGEYLAYDWSLIAFRLVKNKIAGWFLYTTER